MSDSLIPTRVLGQQGLIVSALGLGCMGMSQSYGPADERESIATVHRAIELGMFLLDTANVYGDGHNERLVGRAIADRRDCAVSLSPDDLQRLEVVAPKGAWSGARYATAGQGTYGTSRARS
jgi:diketogulonate reductase-like aldo/keto reductase